MKDSEDMEPIPQCAICESWPETKKFSEHDLFELVRVSDEYIGLLQWFSGSSESNIAVCEVHFNKDEIIREYDENGLPVLKLTNDLVTPTFLTFEECKINNRIGSYTDFLSYYHSSLNTQPNWNMEATEEEVTFMLKNFEIVIRVKSSMVTVVQDGSSTLERGSILQTHLNNGKIVNWSNLRGLMLFCEENSPLTEVMTRLGATVVLEGTEDEMFSSLDDVLCYVKTILDSSWIYEMCPEFNYVVGYQIEPRGSPQITKSIKIHTNFSMTGYINGEIMGTKNPGTIRFLRKMNKEEIPIQVEDKYDEANWNINDVDIENKSHINSFEYMIENISTYLPQEWKMLQLENILLLYNNEIKSIPKLKSVIKLNEKLNCSVYVGLTKIDMNTIIPEFEHKVLTFQSFETIIEALNDVVTTEGFNIELEEGEIAVCIKEEFDNSDSNGFTDPGNKRSLDLIAPDEENHQNKVMKIDPVEILPDNDSDIEIIPSDDPLSVHEATNATSNRYSEERLICKECGEVKSTNSALIRHMLKHKTEFLCQLCSEKFKTPADLRCHMDSNHSVTNRFDCSHCEKYFVVKTDLDAHLIQEHQNNDYYVVTELNQERNIVCEICLTKFKHRQSLYRHLRNIHKDENFERFIITEEENGESMFVCGICNKSKSRFYRLIKIHMESHFKCLRDMQNGSSSENHNYQISHMDQEPQQIFINPESEMILGGNSETDSFPTLTVTSADQTDNYELVFGNDYQEDLDCDEDDEYNEEMAIQEMADIDGLWHCSFCTYKGKSRKNLLYHTLYHKSKYQCTMCLRYYPSRFHLLRHTRTHSEQCEETPVPIEAAKVSNEPYASTSIMIDDSDEVVIKNEFIE